MMDHRRFEVWASADRVGMLQLIFAVYIVGYMDISGALLCFLQFSEALLEHFHRSPYFDNSLLFTGSADGMLFGALGPCPVCSNGLYYYNGQYQCSGNVSEWSKCTYSTTEPVRVKKKWQIPDGTDNDYLMKVCLMKLNACFSAVIF